MLSTNSKLLFYKIKRGELPQGIVFIYNSSFLNNQRYRSFLYIISSFSQNYKDKSWFIKKFVDIRNNFNNIISMYPDAYISAFLSSVRNVDISDLYDYNIISSIKLPVELDNLYKDILHTFAVDYGNKYMIYDFDGNVYMHCKI